MLACVQNGKSRFTTDEQKMFLQRAITILEKWDFKYDLKSVGATIFDGWEFMLMTYLHETKIEDVRLRRSLTQIDQAQMFLFKEIDEWAKESETRQVYC